MYRFDEDRRKGFIAGPGYLVMVFLLGVLWTCVGLLLVAVLVVPGFVVYPTGQDRLKVTKRSEQWSSTGIRAVLHRDLYRGRVT